MAESFDWTTLDLTDEVTLVLGFRPRPGAKELTAGRVELTKNLSSTLATAARGWLQELQVRTRVQYESDPHLEADEYLETSISELAGHAPAREMGPDEQGSELHSILGTAFSSDDWFTSNELRRNFLFYAVVVKLRDGGLDREALTTHRLAASPIKNRADSIAFVKQSSPQRAAKTGGWLTRFSDTLSEITDPVFVLEPDVDIVVHGEHIAVLRPLAFERLFADLELSKELIPEHVKTISTAVPCSPALIEELESVTSRKARARRLLRDISAFTAEQWSARTAEGIRAVLKRRNLDTEEFFDDEGQLATDGENVVTLLEVLASRYFTSDFDEEEMRADKVRRRV